MEYQIINELRNDMRKGVDPVSRLSYYLNNNASIDSVLSLACSLANAQWCEAALNAGAAVNGTDWSENLNSWHMNYIPLCLAVKSQSHDCIRLLIKWGALIDLDYGFDKESAMSKAIQFKDCAIVKLLLQKGATIRGGNYSGIWITQAARISTEMTELFLDYGASPDDIDSPDWSAEIGQMVHRRKCCKYAAVALYQVMRKRFRIPSPGFPGGGYKLPKEIVQQMAREVWDLRKESEWL